MGTTTVPPDGMNARERQTLAALNEANRVRCGRAALLATLAAHTPAESCRMAADIIDDPPELLVKLPVVALLRRVRRMGPTAAARLLEAACVDSMARLEQLSAGERGALAAMVRLRARSASLLNDQARRARNR